MTDSAQAGTQAADLEATDVPPGEEFTATVTAVRELARINGRQVWQMALSRTLFTPEQHNGTLIATAPSGRTLSIDVVHVEPGNSGEVWHTTCKPLQEGTGITGIVRRQT